MFYLNTQGLSNRECMQCVLAAFEILSGQGRDTVLVVAIYIGNLMGSKWLATNFRCGSYRLALLFDMHGYC